MAWSDSHLLYLNTFDLIPPTSNTRSFWQSQRNKFMIRRLPFLLKGSLGTSISPVIYESVDKITPKINQCPYSDRSILHNLELGLSHTKHLTSYIWPDYRPFSVFTKQCFFKHNMCFKLLIRIILVRKNSLEPVYCNSNF